MSDTITFEFYSDTNLLNAYEELSLLAPEILSKEGAHIAVGTEDFSAMEDSIEVIVRENGGIVLYE